MIDTSVFDAKVAFGKELQAAMERGAFPTRDLESPALLLARAARDVLRAQDLFFDPKGGRGVE